MLLVYFCDMYTRFVKKIILLILLILSSFLLYLSIYNSKKHSISDLEKKEQVRYTANIQKKEKLEKISKNSEDNSSAYNDKDFFDQELESSTPKYTVNGVEVDSLNVLKKIKKNQNSKKGYNDPLESLRKNIPDIKSNNKNEASQGIKVFSNEELRTLQNGDELDSLESNLRSFSNGNLIPGFRASSNAQRNEEVLSEEEASESEEVEPLLTGQARGYVMLYLMHPNARTTVQRQLEVLVSSNVKQVYLSVLTDGTFSKDFDFLNSILRRFNELDRNVTLQLYLTNGPSMRRFNDENTVDEGFNKINPQIFRTLIQSDFETREEFRRIVRESLDSFRLNLSLRPENENIVTVMLEDNLTSESYLAMRELAREEIGDLAIFYRNPCLGCFIGNDSFSSGDPIEHHGQEQVIGISGGDGFTLDGQSYRFDNEQNSQALSISDVITIQDLTLSRGAKYFGLWRAERQGIRGPNFLLPNNRVYEVPTEAQMTEEVRILQDGLSP